jgi:hypothetical protein
MNARINDEEDRLELYSGKRFIDAFRKFMAVAVETEVGSTEATAAWIEMLGSMMAIGSTSDETIEDTAERLKGALIAAAYRERKRAH